MLMHRIKLKNILSFGPNEQDLELEPLNVLIGPNGSGKSNLIEVIGLLAAAPTNFSAPIREGGGSENWLWRGEHQDFIQEARMEVVVGSPFYFMEDQRLRYSVAFASLPIGAPHLTEEIGEVGQAEEGEDGFQRFMERTTDKVTLRYQDASGVGSERELTTGLITDQSILSQIKDPIQYPELTSLGLNFGQIHFHREWSLGRNTAPRRPQKADLHDLFVEENGTNLEMVLNRLDCDPKAKNRLLVTLRKLYRGIDDYRVRVRAGSVQVFLKEGPVTIPATRLSDGTLRYLSLLAILCDPSPPRIICFEEPELGLHPDIMPASPTCFAMPPSGASSLSPRTRTPSSMH